MSKKFYAGIGSRKTPTYVRRDLTEIARILEGRGYTLRSGNATGADQAFAMGAKNAQIWLPWAGFENDFKVCYPNHDYRLVDISTDMEAVESVHKFHKSPCKLTQSGVFFMQRNYRQVVGLNEPDSLFIVCWTPEGKETGGTGQALRIAKSLYIPVFNLYTLTVKQLFSEIDKLEMLS